MKYRLLGKSGLRVSEASLGTMTFGDEWGWGSPKDEAQKVYETYREAGGNFIDTANFYTGGTSEKFVGEFIKSHRDSVVLATKYSNAVPGNDPNAAGNHRKSMMQALEASLKRLQTDYIDLYWVHIWDAITPVEEVMRGLDDIVRQGKVLYVGISDAPAWWIAQANTLAELRGWTQFIGLQIEYSLMERTVERLEMACPSGSADCGNSNSRRLLSVGRFAVAISGRFADGTIASVFYRGGVPYSALHAPEATANFCARSTVDTALQIYHSPGFRAAIISELR